MLTSTTRPMTAAERAELEARRERLIAKYTEQEAFLRRARGGAVGSLVWIAGFFALIAVLNLQAGQFDTALVAGIVAAFFGVVTQGGSRTPSLRERPAIARIDAALAAGEVRVVDIRADAAVALRGRNADDQPAIVGDLLRTGADEVVYVSRELCAGVAPERLPNSALRITASENLQYLRVDALGERCEPLAIVEDDSHGDNPQWGSGDELIVWTPSEDRFAVLELGEAEPYAIDLGLEFRRLTTALTRRIYR